MHRTEGDGYILESGNRRFVDKSPPTYVGTVMPGEWANAVQEEIINVVVAAGLTPSVSESADRTLGWNQLKTALFDSEALDTTALADDAVTTDKIFDCDLSKLSWVQANGGADITYASGGITDRLELDLEGITFTKDTTTPDTTNKGLYTYNNIFLEQYDGSDLEYRIYVNGQNANISGIFYTDPTIYESYNASPVVGYTHTRTVSVINEQVNLSYDGLHFVQAGLDSFKTLKFSVADMDGVSWTGSGPWYAYIDTGLSTSSTQPMTAQFRYREVSSGKITVAAATTDTYAYNYIFEQVGGTWRARVTIPDDINGGTYDQRWLTVWYAKI